MTHSLLRILYLSLGSFWLVLGGTTIHAQQSQQEREQRRREKYEAILRVQDLRTPHDGALVSLLGDDDVVVREQATLAYGSIQDTAVLPLLERNLTEGPTTLQVAAAFAIGQTGSQLGQAGRKRLEYELIWKRLDETSVPDRLIEEIGKFGTEEGLGDLMTKIGNAPPFRHVRGLTMCIARYAIRGIITDEAVRYLLRFIRPAEETTWEVAYALQRVGAHSFVRQDIEDVALLAKHRDPVVRMNIAALLGKIRDERSSLEPLARMAEFDNDWRVRVNSLRALAAFPLSGQPHLIAVFRRAFFSDNDDIALTALSVFGQTGLLPADTSDEQRETFRQLRYICENQSGNFPWQHQGAAALALAHLAGPGALPSLSPTTWPEPRLQAEMLEAIGATGAVEGAGQLLAATTADDPLVRCAALTGLQTLATAHASDTTLVSRVYGAACEALEADDIAVVTTAASLLGDSLFLRTDSVERLIERLSRLHVPSDIEGIQEISATLGKLGDRRAVAPLLDVLKTNDRSVALAAADALNRITGQDYRSSLLPWYQPFYTDFDFAYLSTAPSVIRISLQTSRGDITIDLRKESAPFTIMNILKLASQRGFYRGLLFHRVVPNFVVQGGDPRGDGWGGPGYTIRSEFSPLSYRMGTVGIASAGKDTEGSQFFITQSPQPHLDGRYTIIGEVVDGMDVVNRIQVGDRIYDVKIQTPGATPH